MKFIEHIPNYARGEGDKPLVIECKDTKELLANKKFASVIADEGFVRFSRAERRHHPLFNEMLIVEFWKDDGSYSWFVAGHVGPPRAGDERLDLPVFNYEEAKSKRRDLKIDRPKPIDILPEIKRILGIV